MRRDDGRPGYLTSVSPQTGPQNRVRRVNPAPADVFEGRPICWRRQVLYLLNGIWHRFSIDIHDESSGVDIAAFLA